MSESTEKLTERQAELEAEMSEVKLQIAARHGERDIMPTREPADKLQAELSEAARQAMSAKSPDAPADPADDPEDVKAARGDGEPGDDDDADRHPVTGAEVVDLGEGAKSESKAVKSEPKAQTATARK